jgi:hypothetical protein
LTTLTLANDSINQSTSPILFPINAHLEALSNDSPSSSVRRLSREATLVLLVRRAANLSTGTTVPAGITTYRRALTLISDPLLPVRAHGLILLRDLVLSSDYDPALTPSILDVYMQSIQEVDSYIYLNAAKGLAAMVDALGKDVFRTLVRAYSEPVEGGEKLDKVLRVGEALSTVVQRAGKAFSAYGE